MTLNQLFVFTIILLATMVMCTCVKVISGIALTPSGLYVNVYCRYYEATRIYENDFIQIDCSDDNIPEW